MPENQEGYCGTMLQLWAKDGNGLYQKPAMDGAQFVGWSTDPKAKPDSPDLLTEVWSEFTEEETLYAIWQSVFTVRFLNWDGEELWLQKEVPYGTRYGTKGHEYMGKPTEKPADKQYTYVFTQFDPILNNTPITADTTFTAMYEAVPREFDVTWMLEEGKPLQDEKYGYMETPVYKGELPTKGPSGTARYIFKGWDPVPAPITGDEGHLFYYAQFQEVRDAYAVSFDSAGGFPHPEGQIVAYGGAAIRPEPDPVKPGYVFRAWMLDGKDYDFSRLVYNDITLIADWIQIEYSYTSGAGQSWQRGSNTGMSFTVERNIDDSQTFRLFRGVKVDGESVDVGRYTAAEGSLKLTLYPGFLESLDSGKHTLNILFEDGQASTEFHIGFDPRRVYTVLWTDDEGNELEKDEMVPEGSTPEYNGKTPRKPATATESYVFTGWTPEISPVKANVTYRAVFAMKTDGYTVHFEAEGGAPVPPVQVIASGGKAVCPEPEPARKGYEFSGWTLDGRDYSFDQPVLFDLTLYADWKPVDYAVTSGDGQSWVKGSNRGLYFLAERNIFSEKTWKLFKGLQVDGTKLSSNAWVAYPGADYVQVEIRVGYLEGLAAGTHHLSFLFMDGQADATFSVLFEPRNTYTVFWVNDNGIILEKDSMIMEGTVPVYHGETPRKPSTETEAYRFIGWTPEPVPATANAVYTATYEARPLYHITFDTRGGQPVPEAQTVNDGECAVKPGTDPVKKNYRFFGWQLNGKAYDFSKPVHSNLTLQARWFKIPPKTGDNDHPWLWITLLLTGTLGLLGVGGYITVKRKKNR